MAGPTPRDEYNGVPTVSPTTGMPDDYLRLQASPEAFGSQVGAAVQKAGSSVTDAGTKAVDIAVQYQGVLNQAATNAADIQLAVEGGKVNTAFRTKAGFDAVNSKDQAVNDYIAVNNQIRGSLNPAAARAYDQLANRRISYTIADMNDYAAQQQKAGIKGGIQASRQLAVDQASHIEVAGNDNRFGFELGSVKATLNDELTNPAAGGILAGVPFKQQKDATLEFDQTTQQGKTAQAIYDNELNQEVGKVWGLRLQTLANDTTGTYSIMDAYKVLQDNKDQMPAATYAEWSQKLLNPLRNEQARSSVDQLLSDASKVYHDNGGTASMSPPSPNNIGNVKNASGQGFAQPVSPTDGVILATNNLRGPLYQGKTLQDIGKTWEGTSSGNIQNWVNTVSRFSGIPAGTVPDLKDPKTLMRVVKGIMLAEKSSGDQKLFSDDVIGTGVSHALANQKANLDTTPVTQSGVYKTPVDYVSLHEPELIQQSRDYAEKQGFDVTVQDLYAQRMQTRINEMRSAQNGEVRALSDDILSRVMNDKAPISNITYLDNSSDPQVRNTWLQLQSLNPYARQTIQNIVSANAQGKSRSYGSAFYTHLQSVLTGKVTDPTTLADYIGGDKSPVSASGFTALQKESQNIQTPSGQAFAKDESIFFKRMRDETTGLSVFPGSTNSAGEARMNTFLEIALPQIEAGRAQGKTSADLFDPKSPDYVGRFLKVPAPPALYGELGGSLANQTVSPTAPETYNSLSDLQKAVKDRKLTRAAAEGLALKNKWIQPNPPSVPLPPKD